MANGIQDDLMAQRDRMMPIANFRKHLSQKFNLNPNGYATSRLMGGYEPYLRQMPLLRNLDAFQRGAEMTPENVLEGAPNDSDFLSRLLQDPRGMVKSGYNWLRGYDANEGEPLPGVASWLEQQQRGNPGGLKAALFRAVLDPRMAQYMIPGMQQQYHTAYGPGTELPDQNILYGEGDTWGPSGGGVNEQSFGGVFSGAGGDEAAMAENYMGSVSSPTGMAGEQGMAHVANEGASDAYGIVLEATGGDEGMAQQYANDPSLLNLINQAMQQTGGGRAWAIQQVKDALGI